eukprot:9888850-Alexandrium_andersonii.AAC.1
MDGENAREAPLASPGSIPQGDPLAMGAMLVVLLPPVARITARAPQIALSVFADDRNALGDSQAMRL